MSVEVIIIAITQAKKMEVEWCKSPAGGLVACEMKGDSTQLCMGTLIGTQRDTQVERYMHTYTQWHNHRWFVLPKEKPQEWSRATPGKGPL